LQTNRKALWDRSTSQAVTYTRLTSVNVCKTTQNRKMWLLQIANSAGRIARHFLWLYYLYSTLFTIFGREKTTGNPHAHTHTYTHTHWTSHNKWHNITQICL